MQTRDVTLQNGAWTCPNNNLTQQLICDNLQHNLFKIVILKYSLNLCKQLCFPSFHLVELLGLSMLEALHLQSFLCMNLLVHKTLFIGSIHKWSSKKECLIFNTLQMTILNFPPIYIIIIVVDCCMLIC